jgi:hypothetical protein
MVLYLGLGKLLIGLLRRGMEMNIFASLLVHLLLLTIGTGIPMIIYGMSPDIRDYTLLQVTNPFWSIEHCGGHSRLDGDAYATITIITTLAAVVFLLNLPSIAAELGYIRVAAPKRIVEDDAELSPAPLPAPQSPWD